MNRGKKIKTRSYFAVVWLLFFSFLAVGTVAAQDQKFSAAVSKTEVATGEGFEVSFEIKGNGERFTAPAFEGFQIVSGPNVSQSMTSINGNTMVSSSYSYVLVPVKVGTFTIGQATVVIANRKYGTAPITIKVVKGQPVPQGNGQQGNGRQNMPDDVGNERLPADIGKSLFLKSDVSKTTVYQGEQLVLSYRLYTRAGIVDSRVDKLPDLNGFWSEDIKSPQQVQWRVETYKGQKYHVADVKKTILFAEHSGNITINPFEMTFIVRVPGGSSGDELMDQFFGSYKDVKYATKSAPVVIHVKPLPENGKPASFTGAVGKFTLAASLDKKEIKANEALNYTVKVNGAGNIKLFKEPNINFPPDFEKYDPKITDTVGQQDGDISGKRIYKYLVIPRHQGNFKIDPLLFSYFNPASGKYVELSTDGFSVKVNKGIEEKNVTAFSAANQQGIKTLDKDIRYIKTGDTSLRKMNDQFFGSLWYVLLLLAGPAAAVLAFIYRNRERVNNLDQAKVKSRKAARIVAKHLANAQKQLAAGHQAAFYEAIFKGLYGYLSDKLNISMADLNRENIADHLRSRSVSDQVIHQLWDTLDLCEMARFAPVQVSDQQVFDKAKSIINDIENGI